MSLNCFFGIEVKPDGIPVIPIIPPHSSLVITQCAVTSVCAPSKPLSVAPDTNSANNNKTNSSDNDKPTKVVYGGPVTLYVQSHEIPTRFAVCTLDPSHGVTFCPLQLIFSKHAALTLLTESANKTNTNSKAKDSNVESTKSNKETSSVSTDSRNGTKTTSSSVEEPTWYPTVHLTGYYEAEEEEEEEEEEENDDELDEEDMQRESEEEQEEKEEFYGKGNSHLRRRRHNYEVYEDDDDDYDVQEEAEYKKLTNKSNNKRQRSLTSQKEQESQRGDHKNKNKTKKKKKISQTHNHDNRAVDAHKKSKQSKHVR